MSDFSENMLGKLRERSLPMENVTVQQANNEELPFGDA
jgi:ubiquinone/menaquinone biosynthesis C-methylase UbiE